MNLPDARAIMSGAVNVARVGRAHVDFLDNELRRHEAGYTVDVVGVIESARRLHILDSSHHLLVATLIVQDAEREAAEVPIACPEAPSWPRRVWSWIRRRTRP